MAKDNEGKSMNGASPLFPTTRRRSKGVKKCGLFKVVVHVRECLVTFGLFVGLFELKHPTLA